MNPYPITLLYDGACPICIHEMARLARHRMAVSRALGFGCAGDRCGSKVR